MYTWWAFIDTTNGGFIKATVQANTPYEACEIMRNMYGNNFRGTVARC
jgi:hypothetical protein